MWIPHPVRLLVPLHKPSYSPSSTETHSSGQIPEPGFCPRRSSSEMCHFVLLVYEMPWSHLPVKKLEANILPEGLEGEVLWGNGSSEKAEREQEWEGATSPWECQLLWYGAFMLLLLLPYPRAQSSVWHAVSSQHIGGEIRCRKGT